MPHKVQNIGRYGIVLANTNRVSFDVNKNKLGVLAVVIILPVSADKANMTSKKPLRAFPFHFVSFFLNNGRGELCQGFLASNKRIGGSKRRIEAGFPILRGENLYVKQFRAFFLVGLFG